VRIGIQQRALPQFRVALYDAIARATKGEVEVFTGHPESDEGVRRARSLNHATWRTTKNRRFSVGQHRFYWQKDFRTWIKKFRPDVLLVESNPRILSNYSGIRLARYMDILVIGWGIGVMGNSEDTGLYGRAMRNYFLQFDGMIAYGSKGARDFINLGVGGERVFIAPNAVFNEAADKLFRNPKEARELVRDFKERRALGHCPIILFLGRMIEEKNIDLLLDSMTKVNQQCQLLLVGDGPIKKRLEERAKVLQINANFTGYLEGLELALAINACDVCVLPGSGGLAVQEVMGMGRPVISGKADGTQYDLIQDGVTGFHLNLTTSTALSERLSFCLSRPNLLKRLGSSARKFVLEKHNVHLTVDGVFSAIRALEER